MKEIIRDGCTAYTASKNGWVTGWLRQTMSTWTPSVLIKFHKCRLLIVLCVICDETFYQKSEISVAIHYIGYILRVHTVYCAAHIGADPAKCPWRAGAKISTVAMRLSEILGSGQGFLRRFKRFQQMFATPSTHLGLPLTSEVLFLGSFLFLQSSPFQLVNRGSSTRSISRFPASDQGGSSPEL